DGSLQVTASYVNEDFGSGECALADDITEADTCVQYRRDGAGCYFSDHIAGVILNLVVMPWNTFVDHPESNQFSFYALFFLFFEVVSVCEVFCEFCDPAQ